MSKQHYHVNGGFTFYLVSIAELKQVQFSQQTEKIFQ